MEPLIRIGAFAHVAKKYGLNESIFLEYVVTWWRCNRANNRNFHDGRWWTYNSLSAFEEIFWFLTPSQVRNTIRSCRDQGAVLTGCYNEDKRDRSLWYSPSDELLELYGETANCICQKEQMQFQENADPSATGSRPLPDSTQLVQQDTPYNPPQGEAAGDAVEQEDKPKAEPKPRARGKRSAYKPDWFDALWKIYPKKNAKLAAQKKWDALKPDRETCRAILAGLERDKRSEQWQKDKGQYIPLLSTYLHQRRWEDQGVDVSQLPPPPEDRPRISWGDDREVT